MRNEDGHDVAGDDDDDDEDDDDNDEDDDDDENEDEDEDDDDDDTEDVDEDDDADDACGDDDDDDCGHGARRTPVFTEAVRSASVIVTTALRTGMNDNKRNHKTTKQSLAALPAVKP